MEYGFKRTIKKGFQETETKLREKLMENGFGVVSEINVQDTFKQKLNIEFNKYKILGACKPQVAHKALTLDKQIGLLLPCNLVIWENDENTTTIASIDPRAQLSLAEKSELDKPANEINQQLINIVESI